ncbi:MAG: hypothetical protein COU11_01185 [Candidatus Harrisonbacteria bacterium CG10_big_fil_rev_8_21_14_0_10_49_15]|uniref:Histidine phosphatase family protein n=1 Tax=Candidatus Harrisonbacteria bacterium CG10_big_fil_rev_8_21_14_0_10_49_15 TaxID=1974587 RepID=A0A2H0ULQ5_9BACT|nr:MAG: hypothetical protein COU11_01185 [Candidatus Harrisonbacteria bacterium CG10_big_fil_rev_8_21_14_0_10_49_15]
MKLYLIRHGETESNINRIYQGKDEQLSAQGKKQALFVTQRLKEISLDAIISSPAVRAQETAAYIANPHDIPIQILDELKERVWPKEFIGKPKNDPRLQSLRKILEEKDHTEPDWHYADEENFTDIKNRCSRAKEYFESLAATHKHVAIVTHVRFLKLFLCTLLYGEKTTAEIFYPFFENVSVNNTALTVCEYLPELAKERQWHIITINDHAHLGEPHRQLAG